MVECPGEGDFTEGAAIATIDGRGSDSSSLGRISWSESDQCETVTLEFQTEEGAPATTVPDIHAGHLDTFQVIRIEVGVDSTVITDQLVETGLVDRLYVVRRLGGGMFVDLHLSAPAAARVTTQSSPARVVLDLRPGLVPFNGVSTVGPNMVIVFPGASSGVAPEAEITGYSRTPGTDLSVIVSQDQADVSTTVARAADGRGTWSEFRANVTLPLGAVSVFVGEPSPVGGLEGVSVELEVS